MSIVRLIVATRSSGPPASQPAQPGLVASGTHCISLQNLALIHMVGGLFNFFVFLFMY